MGMDGIGKGEVFRVAGNVEAARGRTGEPAGPAIDPAAELLQDGLPASSSAGQENLASHTVPVATPEQEARGVMNPWILLKVKALGELLPAAGIELERLLDEGGDPHYIAVRLLQDHKVRLSDIEVARYGSWLPEIRRDALRRSEAHSEWLVQEVRRRQKARER